MLFLSYCNPRLWGWSSGIVKSEKDCRSMNCHRVRGGGGAGGGFNPPPFLEILKCYWEKGVFSPPPPSPPLWVTIQPSHFQSSSAGPGLTLSKCQSEPTTALLRLYKPGRAANHCIRFNHGPPSWIWPRRTSTRCNIHEVSLLSWPVIFDSTKQSLDPEQYSWG